MIRKKAYWTEQLGEGWTEILKPLLITEEFNKMLDVLMINNTFSAQYPEDFKSIFKAFKLCPWENLQMVIIGTEPGFSTGRGPLAFSDVDSSYTNPCASLIKQCVAQYKKELYLDFDTSFEYWANQGILMLNRSLTSDQNTPNAHKEQWKKFFGAVLYVIEKYKPGTIFLLWGKDAQKYTKVLNSNHHVFTWEHPMKARLQYREWKCPNFAQVNKLLEYHGRDKINW